MVSAGCKESSPPPTTPPTAPARAARQPPAEPGTWYRARLAYDGVGELPFFLHVPPVGQNGRAYVVNGDETADFQAEWRDNEITITGPWAYTSMIEAQLRPGNKNLEGTWTRDTPLWGAVARNFLAVPVPAADPRTRFSPPGAPAGSPATAATPINVAGIWKFEFAAHKEGKGRFEQGPDGVVRGYIKPGMLGDVRFLAGNLQPSGGGAKLGLSTFNGNAANLVLADVAADGNSMSGIMSLQNVWNERFTAKRSDDFTLANKVHLKEGKTTVTLRGFDKYKGKPTMAIIFATWCSSCNDAYPFFRQLYATYHAQGLEMFGVAYDLNDDEKINNTQLEAFRVKHQIPWEQIQVPCTPETWAQAMPPEIEGWDGLPIILLIKPDGTVPVVFGGWLGPATGADGERLRQWLEEQIKELVGSAGAKTKG